MAGRTPEPGPSWRLRDRQDNHVAEAVGPRGVQWETDSECGGADHLAWRLGDPLKDFCVY